LPAHAPPVLQQFALPSLFLPQVAQGCPTSAGFPAAGVVVALVTRDAGSPSGPIWLVDSAEEGRAVDTAAALASGHSANPTESRRASRMGEPFSMPIWEKFGISQRRGTFDLSKQPGSQRRRDERMRRESFWPEKTPAHGPVVFFLCFITELADNAAQRTQPPAPRLGRGLLAGVRLACRSQTHAGRANDVRRWR
jgi:hypothetical protein